MKARHCARTAQILTLCCVLTIASWWASFCAAAAQQSTTPMEIHIPAQPLTDALKTLADQTGLQFAYEGDIDARLMSPGISGTYSPEAALARMLEPSGLAHHYINARTVAIDTQPYGGGAQTSTENKVRLPAGSQTRLATAGAGREYVASSAEEAGEGSQQDVAARSRDLAEVIVTSQKREERLIDVPISIVAMTNDELVKRRIQDLDDLAFAVPGLAIESTGWQRRVQLRGIGNGQGNFSLIGLYFDEADVTTTGTAQLDLNTYDLERVEVLRGPQGTLYGEGSAGGTLRFISRSPALNGFGMNADVAALFTQDGSPSQRINAMVNVPLITGTMGLRVAGTFDHEGGWIDQPAADRKDINEQNKSDVRVKWLWKPAAQFTADAMVVIHRNDSSTNLGEDRNGNYTQAFNLTTTPVVKDNYNLYDLTLSYDFGAARLLNTVSYVDQDRNSRDFGYISPSNPGVPVAALYFNPYEPVNRIATDELRLSSSGTGPWQWTFGGIYRHAQLKLIELFNFAVPGPPGTPVPALLNGGNQTLSKSWAAFGDSNYKITDRFTLGAGLRYFKDDQEYTTTSIQNGSFHAVNPRGYAQFKLTDKVNVYASAAKGFRSGGFNSLKRPSYGPESVWTYELGSKTALLDSRVSADVAVFYSDYTNYQIVGVTSSGFSITSNAGSADIKGIEWQTSWRPADQWTLSLNGDYVDTAFYRINATKSAFAVGDELPFIPKYTVNVSVQRDFNLYDKPTYARLDYNRQGRESTRNRSIGSLYQGESDIIDMLNLNVGAELNSDWTVSFFAQNLLNDRGFTDPYAFINDAARSRPRTFGFEFSASLH